VAKGCRKSLKTPQTDFKSSKIPRKRQFSEMSVHRSEILRQNRAVYDAMADAQDPLCRVAKDEDLVNPLQKVDPLGWLGSVAGKRLLCLAAGGGRQSSIYAAAGADVTVVDLSPAMLELDRVAAKERNHRVRVVETSMDELSMFQVGEFDLVVHPVSTCYLPDIVAIYRQVARVTRVGGIYVSQHKTPTSLQSNMHRVAGDHYKIEHAYYRSEPVPTPTTDHSAARRLREHGAIEYLHRWEQIVGGLCRSGFVIEDLVEPKHCKPGSAVGTFADRANYIAPYVRIKAQRKGELKSAALFSEIGSTEPDAGTNERSSIWLPD
jgi:SAM-dependent methyltransferase